MHALDLSAYLGVPRFSFIFSFPVSCAEEEGEGVSLWIIGEWWFTRSHRDTQETSSDYGDRAMCWRRKHKNVKDGHLFSQSHKISRSVYCQFMLLILSRWKANFIGFLFQSTIVIYCTNKFHTRSEIFKQRLLRKPNFPCSFLFSHTKSPTNL